MHEGLSKKFSASPIICKNRVMRSRLVQHSRRSVFCVIGVSTMALKTFI
jgi:hypothetical protein